MKKINYLLATIFILLILNGTALAHRVNLFAYVDGGKIYTESYFPDGKPVKGGNVLVYDSREKLLVQGITDKEGLFNFPVPAVDDLKIVIDATMGHRNSFELKKSEVEEGK
ncbi:MAG: carboxypeptidase regulatory-like domain-containing protein [Thermodesulfobacteriota bacterium]